MSFSDTPNRLEAVYVQRDTTNVRYDQINVSGSDMIVYLNELGKLDADKISIWATKYNIGSGGSGSVASASFAATASRAVSASFATTASNSISASYAFTSSNSITASYALTSSAAIEAISASYFSGSQITASSILVSLILPLGSSIGNPTQSFATVYATRFIGTSSYVSASVIDGPVLSSSYALTASFALNGGGSGGSSSVAFSASQGMLALDGDLWGAVPFFVSSGHMSASKLTSTDDGTMKFYASALSSPPMQKVVYIGRDGNTNTWAALGFYNDAGGINSKYWLNYADNANLLNFAAAADDFSIVSPWLTVTRSGSAITQILFQKAVTINGNVLPNTNLTNSLGTASLQWKNAWIANMIGTASVATSAFTASSINFVPSSSISASFASMSISASYAPSSPSISASYALSASYSDNAATASLLLGSVQNATFALSASFASSSLSASIAILANTATSASLAAKSLISISASFASSSLSASYVSASNVVGSIISASYSFSASYAPGNPSISSSFATTASYSNTSSFTLGNIDSANQAISASFASSSLSASISNRSISASYALTASFAGTVLSSSFATTSSFSANVLSSSYAGTASVVLGNIASANQAISASFASQSLSSSWASTSSYPWSASSAGNPYHNIAAVGIGTLSPPASRLSILEPVTNSAIGNVVTIYGNRTDTTTMSLEIRNLEATSSNSTAGIRLGLGIGLEGGNIFVSRTATPSFGIVNGLNISTTAGSSDIGIRAGLALSGSVAGPHIQIKSAGTIGMGVATPVNARLHIGGTDLAFYNATLRMTNGAAGGADVFFAATDDAWGGSVTGKLLIGTGDPSAGTQILQLYPPSASVGVGIASNVSPQAKLHVQGNISASSVTASLWGTASWAQNINTASYALNGLSSSYSATASILLGSVQNATFAVSASFASQSLSASYITASAINGTVASASYALAALSASYAPSSPSISASYALTASFALNAGGSTISSRNMVLCAAFTPYLTGADFAEMPVPYSTDGVTPLSWSVNRLNLRVQLSGSTTSSVTIEKSSAIGSFVTDTTLGNLVLTASSYQTFTGSKANIVSGDKIRFNVSTIGTAQYWTITAEIASL